MNTYIVLSVFMLSFIFGLFRGSESVQFYYRLFIYVLPLEIQLSRENGWDPINRFNPQALVSLKKYMPFSPSPLRLNIFRLFVILSLTQLYHYTPEIFLFSTVTFEYTYRAPPQTNWTRIFSERRFVYFSVIETDTATSGPV
jgi:hypothetical protein